MSRRRSHNHDAEYTALAAATIPDLSSTTTSTTTPGNDPPVSGSSDQSPSSSSSKASISPWRESINNPLAFTTFLLSLTYIDWRARSWRAAQRSHQQEQPQNPRSTKWAAHPPSSPHQDPRRGGAWVEPRHHHHGGGGGSDHGHDHDESGGDGAQAVHKMVRKVIGMEVDDAFAARPVVAAVLVVALLFAVAVGWLVLAWTWGALVRPMVRI